MYQNQGENMSKKQYRVNFTERIYIGGMDFTSGGQVGANSIIECLEYTAKHAMTKSSYDSGAYSAWTKTKKKGCCILNENDHDIKYSLIH